MPTQLQVIIIKIKGINKLLSLETKNNGHKYQITHKCLRGKNGHHLSIKTENWTLNNTHARIQTKTKLFYLLLGTKSSKISFGQSWSISISFILGTFNLFLGYIFWYLKSSCFYFSIVLFCRFRSCTKSIVLIMDASFLTWSTLYKMKIFSS